MPFFLSFQSEQSVQKLISSSKWENIPLRVPFSSWKWKITLPLEGMSIQTHLISLQLFKNMNKSSCQAYNLWLRSLWFFQGTTCRTRILSLWNASPVSKQRSLFHNSSASSTLLICLKHLLHKYPAQWLMECEEWGRIQGFFFLFLFNQNAYSRKLWCRKTKSGFKLCSRWSSDQSLKGKAFVGSQH